MLPSPSQRLRTDTGNKESHASFGTRDEEINMKDVQIYTDGACRGNPGRGGWAAILVYGAHERELSGGERETTNNRMELTAVIEGLSALKYPCKVTVYSDSKYVVEAFAQNWIAAWKASGWKKGLKNPDLWQKLYPLTEIHDVTFVWVKGHDGHIYNERCDKLATAYADSLDS